MTSVSVYTISLQFKIIFYTSKPMLTRSNMIFSLLTTASIIVNIFRILVTNLHGMKSKTWELLKAEKAEYTFVAGDVES